MAKNSQEYWAERARQDKVKVIKTGEQGINNLKRLLLLNLKDVESKIKDFYDKYGDTPAEYMTHKDWEKYKARLKKLAGRYPDDKFLQKIAKQNVPKYQIDRLKALELDLQMQLTEATSGQEQGIYKTLNDVSKVSQATLAKRMKQTLGLTFNSIADRKMKQILMSDWSGSNWSDRLWVDRAVVGKKVTEILEKGVVQGTSLQKMASELKQATNQSFNNAFRLIRTETSHIDGQVTLEGYKQAGQELGLEYYEYDAFLDSRTSNICRELDKKRFKVSEAEVGVNYPPMHPNCRSTTQLVLDEDYKQNLEPKPTKNPQKFIDGVINKNLNPPQNEVKVGTISSNVSKFLKEQGIELNQKNIDLTYKKVQHALRDNKNPLQKLSSEQLKRIDKIIRKNNVYFDTKKQNIVYVDELPIEEIKEGRNWIKIPVNLAYKKGKNNIIGTASIIPEISITHSKEYKKID